MKIKNSKGEIYHVKRQHEKTVRKHIKDGNHSAISELFANPQGMQEISNSPVFANGGALYPNPGIVYNNGYYPQYGFGSTVGSFLKTIAPVAAPILAATGVGAPLAAGIAAGASLAGTGLESLDNSNNFSSNPTSVTNTAPAHSHQYNLMQNQRYTYDTGGPVMPPMQSINKLTPINVEGNNFSQGTKAQASKGEVLVKDGIVYKNYVSRPPHPAQGSDSGGNVQEEEGMVVIPKDRSEEYLNADMRTRKTIERSLVSQQDYRTNKHLTVLKEGGLITLPVYAKGGKIACDACEDADNEIDQETLDAEMMKSGGWIQKATASIKRRGTEGKCTPITKPGCTGRARALALTFKKIARNRKHEDGGQIMAEGGRTRYPGLSPFEHAYYKQLYAGGGGVTDTETLIPQEGPIPYDPAFPQIGENLMPRPGTGFNINIPGQTQVQPNSPWVNKTINRIPGYNLQRTQLSSIPRSSNAKIVNNTSTPGAPQTTDGFQKAQMWGAAAQLPSIINNFAESLGPNEQTYSQKITPGSPRYITDNQGRRDIIGTYRNATKGMPLTGRVSSMTKTQEALAGHDERLQNANAAIYNQYLQSKLGADQYNSQADIQDQLTRLGSKAKKREYRGQALADVGKGAQNYINNDLYYKLLTKNLG